MKFLLFLLWPFLAIPVAAQSFLDSLHNKLYEAKEDTSKIKATGDLAQYYGVIRFDSSIYYSKLTLDLAEKSKYDYGIFLAYRSIFGATNTVGDYPKALEWAIKELKIAEQLKNHRLACMAWSHFGLELVSREVHNDHDAIMHFSQAVNLQMESGEPLANIHDAYAQMAALYLNSQRLDSALAYAEKAYELASQSTTINKIYVSLELAILGTIEQALGNFHLAEKYYRLGIAHARKYNILYLQARLFYNLAGLFNKMNEPDSCTHYALASLQLCQQFNYGSYAFDASKTLMEFYESEHKPDSSLKYMKLMLAAKDSTSNQQKVRQFQLLVFDEKQRQQEMEAAKERYQNLIRSVILLSALAMFLIIALILYRNNQQKRKANKLLENTLSNLRATQSQLIQSEKMASLGELTAGIAHEIQNPLNFVNNFSEVNGELIDEAEFAITKGDLGQAKELLENLRNNQIKINHHGRRADAIVKGMLQHAQAGSGQKDLTDINELADEYLRISYQQLRSKDNTFNATLVTDYDPRIGKIRIVPQDIGRVLLNLYNNAFYSVSEKKKGHPAGYEPCVSVRTLKINGRVEIRVKDNGEGIPEKIKEKIFQPFFTTKPTGEGTGLGLSLSFDIVKAHGGDILVETEEGEGSEFVIQFQNEVHH